MIPAKQLLNEIAAALRNVVAPAIADPYPKSQAYMAAVVLEFIAQQVEERSDVAEGKRAAIAQLAGRIAQIGGAKEIAAGGPIDEEGLSTLIEQLYAERKSLGEETFAAANRVVRDGLRRLLDEELKIARKGED